jgi:hypothetical protein
MLLSQGRMVEIKQYDFVPVTHAIRIKVIRVLDR